MYQTRLHINTFYADRTPTTIESPPTQTKGVACSCVQRINSNPCTNTTKTLMVIVLFIGLHNSATNNSG